MGVHINLKILQQLISIFIYSSDLSISLNDISSIFVTYLLFSLLYYLLLSDSYFFEFLEPFDKTETFWFYYDFIPCDFWDLISDSFDFTVP